jgi:hypothetical protein
VEDDVPFLPFYSKGYGGWAGVVDLLLGFCWAAEACYGPPGKLPFPFLLYRIFFFVI